MCKSEPFWLQMTGTHLKLASEGGRVLEWLTRPGATAQNPGSPKDGGAGVTARWEVNAERQRTAIPAGDLVKQEVISVTQV